MVHRYNQRVFATPDTGSPLLCSYLRLVGIEIALKNRDAANWSARHQIDAMIAALGKPALQVLVQRVNTILGALWCERSGGGAQRVPVTSYPQIRYLRHTSDFPGAMDASSDVALGELRLAVDELAAELRREGLLT